MYMLLRVIAMKQRGLAVGFHFAEDSVWVELVRPGVSGGILRSLNMLLPRFQRHQQPELRIGPLQPHFQLSTLLP